LQRAALIRSVSQDCLCSAAFPQFVRVSDHRRVAQPLGDDVVGILLHPIGRARRPQAETIWGGENVQPKVSMSRCGWYGKIRPPPLSHAGTPPSRPNSHAISNLCRYFSIWRLRGRGVPRPFPKSRDRHGQGRLHDGDLGGDAG